MQIPGKFLRKGLLIFIVLCLGIPSVLTELLGVEVPLSVLGCLVSVPFYFLIPNIREKFYISVAFILSLVSVLFNAVFVSTRIEVSPFLSMAYFFIPYILFFPGYYLIETRKDMSFVMKMFSVVFVIVSLAIASSILASGGTVRSGGELLGSLLGFKLYGTYGVNSLAVFYATMFSILVIHVFFSRNYLEVLTVPYMLGMAGLLFLLIGSLSREAVLGAGLFMVFSILYFFKENKFLGFSLVAVIISCGYIVSVTYGEEIRLLWSTKYNVAMSALGEVDLDRFSSGRLTLYKYAIKDILIDPLFGNGFHGFFLHIRPGLHAEEIAGNNSPHNQFLTAIWKMGLLAGVFYLLFIIKCMKNLFLLQRWEKRTGMYAGLWILMLVYILVFCFLWDVLLVPLIGMFVMFLFGGISRIFTMERQLLRAQPPHCEEDA